MQKTYIERWHTVDKTMEIMNFTKTMISIYVFKMIYVLSYLISKGR